MNNKSDKYKKSLEETYDQTTLYTQEINDSTLDTKLSSKQSVRTVLPVSYTHLTLPTKA